MPQARAAAMRGRRGASAWPAVLLWAAAPAALARAAGPSVPPPPAGAAAPGRAERLCPQVEFLGEERPALTEAERRLACGDPDSEGWRQVPLTQAERFLRAFLQQRGFHHPRFFVEGGTLKVWPGPRTRIAGVEASGLPPDLRISRRRRVVGAWLTPAALDGLQSWLAKELQSRGHGCPAIGMSADADSGVVRADVEPGPAHAVDRIEEAATGMLDPGVFRRFEAFQYGRPLDLRLLNLSAARVVAEDLFLSAYYDLRCSGSALSITQHVVTAPPRLITAGAGFDSEDLVRARVRWRNSRVGWRASRVEAVLFGSQRLQSGRVEARWYPAPAARWYLQPRAEGRREAELRYEAAFAGVSLMPGVDWDDQAVRLSARAGPGFEYVRTLQGQGPPDESYLTLRTRLQATSHLFEYYSREPREGWYAAAETLSRQTGAYSEFTAHQVRLEAQALWNVGRYDPPWLVAGWRTRLGATLTDRRSEALGALPAALRFFLGGDADLRGFARKELPLGGEGYLTMMYQGVELRLGDVLGRKLQPLVFLDGAVAGRTRLHLDRELYWSPGFGVRWSSPVGGLRATLARSYTTRRDPTLIPYKPHWQFFFSWGQEF